MIASLNGASTGGWVRYGKLIQDAGADALELNVYFVAADPDESGEQVEPRYLDLVAAVRGGVTIPLAVKVGPYFSAMANMARRLEAPVRTASCCSTASSSRTSTSTRCVWIPRCTCRRATSCGCP